MGHGRRWPWTSDSLFCVVRTTAVRSSCHRRLDGNQTDTDKVSHASSHYSMFWKPEGELSSACQVSGKSSASGSATQDNATDIQN